MLTDSRVVALQLKDFFLIEMIGTLKLLSSVLPLCGIAKSPACMNLGIQADTNGMSLGNEMSLSLEAGS